VHHVQQAQDGGRVQRGGVIVKRDVQLARK